MELMTPDSRRRLAARVALAADAALTRQKYVSAIDVLVGVGWRAPEAVERWRKTGRKILSGGLGGNSWSREVPG
jgi:hypothetical protein